MPFNIVVVGTGIGGLSTAIALTKKGHQVTVLEATAKLQAVGGVIVVQANACRALDQLGVYQPFLDICAEQPLVRIHRRFDGQEIAEIPAGDSQRLYGYPPWSVHRHDYQQVLYHAAIDRGAKVRLGCAVVSVDQHAPSVTLSSGEVIQGDVIVGADGAKSVVREAINIPSERGVTETGIDITRFNIPRTTMESDPLTAAMSHDLSLWYGFNTGMASTAILHQGHWWNGYDLLHKQCPSSAPGPGQPQDLNDLKKFFSSWGRVVQKLFSYVTEAHVWRMIESMPSNWVSDSGRVVLVGDACHAVLPNSGQGGGLAVEDAVTLAECLSRAAVKDDISKLLHFYQDIRKPRCQMVQNLGRAMKMLMFLPDGPEQEARDQRYKNFKAWQYNEPWDGNHIDELPDSIRAPNYGAWQNGHDARLFANRRLDQMSGIGANKGVHDIVNGHGRG